MRPSRPLNARSDWDLKKLEARSKPWVFHLAISQRYSVLWTHSFDGRRGCVWNWYDINIVSKQYLCDWRDPKIPSRTTPLKRLICPVHCLKQCSNKSKTCCQTINLQKRYWKSKLNHMPSANAINAWVSLKTFHQTI